VAGGRHRLDLPKPGEGLLFLVEHKLVPSILLRSFIRLDRMTSATVHGWPPVWSRV